MPFKDCTFDFVLIVVTLCFVKNPEYVLVEAGRVLKSGGRLIVGEINKDNQLGRLYEAKKEKSGFYKIATFYLNRYTPQLCCKWDKPRTMQPQRCSKS